MGAFALPICGSHRVQAQGEISPGKNALLHCTTAGFTPPTLGHKSFAARCPLALLGIAFYPVLVHRLTVLIHASFPRSVTLTQLRFTSFAVVNSREDLHIQDCAHAGRTTKKASQALLVRHCVLWSGREDLNLHHLHPMQKLARGGDRHDDPGSFQGMP